MEVNDNQEPQPSKRLKLPRSFIKNVAIQLRNDYKLSSNPFELEDIDPGEQQNSESGKQTYIGRKNHIDKFKAFLNSSAKGIYLVTGYRGMGKTSFVNHVINQFVAEKSKNNERDKKKIIPIHLTLAQSNPKEFDVLRQVVSSIYDRLKFKNDKTVLWLSIRKYLIGLLLLVIVPMMLILFSQKEQGVSLVCWDKSWIVLTAAASVSFLIFIATIIIEISERKNVAYNRIKNLLDRCYSSVTEERNVENNFTINGISTKKNNRRLRLYPIAHSKEIEYELLEFLKLIKKENIEFIFIFDELDKIELQYAGININEDLPTFESRYKSNDFQNTLRYRKQAVISIITGLKNFFTTANARFIFIAGREMFDASLADIADKQSPLSSIFTYVFHIESLLKEEHGHKGEKNTSSLSIGIEEFLKFQLFSKEEIDTKRFNGMDTDSVALMDIMQSYSNGTAEEDAFLQTYFLMQGFITYLVYRSSGSPKKLIRAFHEFVVVDKEFEDEKVTIQKNRGACNQSKSYLYFNHQDQYRIGFINSFYRPYIIGHGRSYKLFSENTVISVPYLFDHLFKFHPFAFSISNLEMIPEILSSNKAHSLRHDLKQVINYLYQNHIRDTDMELFDYKFNSKTANEITFISRIFEEEAAAFNFTLDESFSVKALLTEKIKELRNIHSKFDVDPVKFNPQIFSISNLNSNLGDLYFFDQEFDSALNCYSDAIRSVNNIEVSKINFRDFVTLVRNKLKIGLCFEKINSYDEALAFYSDSVQDIKRYFHYFMNNANYIVFKDEDEMETDSNYNDSTATEKQNLKTHNYYTSALNDLLHICVQSFLSNLYIQEKIGIEGVTTTKVRVEFSDFLNIVTHVGKHCGRNRLIIANSMLHHGKMLYYKNSQVPTKDKFHKNKSNYPKWFDHKSQEIGAYFNYDQHARRQPLLALRVYLLGLDEVLRSREYFDDNSNIGKDGFLLFQNPNSQKEKPNWHLTT